MKETSSRKRSVEKRLAKTTVVEREKPVARIVVPSLAEYPKMVIEDRLPGYQCEVVEDDYFVRPALITTRGEPPCDGQGLSIATVLDLLYQEWRSSHLEIAGCV